MKTVRFKGTAKHPAYKGFDGESAMYVQPGEVVNVSDEKFAQLMADFPENWEEVKAPKKAASEPAVVDPATEKKETDPAKLKKK